MKRNRVLFTFVLTALLSGAAMVAHAQTGVYLQFGGGRAPIVAAQYYQPPCPGPGYFWIAGYYSNGYWVPGYWALRDNDDGYYGAYYNNYYRGDDDHRWRRDDDWRDRRWRDDDDHHWRDDDHHDNGWHRGWDHDRRDDH